MNLTRHDLEQLHDLALVAAKRAGDLVQSRVGKHRKALTKASGGNTLASQVVTEVDLESQRLILELLEDSLKEFALGLLTEEKDDDSSRFEGEAFWCVDPLDGTLPFVEGTAGYSVSIALVSRQGESLIGVVRDPVESVTYHAYRGGGAYCDELSMSASDHRGDQTKLFWMMDRSMKRLATFASIEGALAKAAVDLDCLGGVQTVDYGGAALNGCWVARNAPAVYFKLPKPEKGGGSLWDFAASACVMSECEMSATDIHGLRLDLNRSGSTFMNERGVLYASSGDLATAVRQIYRESEDSRR